MNAIGMIQVCMRRQVMGQYSPWDQTIRDYIIWRTNMEEALADVSYCAPNLLIDNGTPDLAAQARLLMSLKT